MLIAGLVTSVIAGHLFYLSRPAPGAAYIAMTVGFLIFATRAGNDNNHKNDIALNKISVMMSKILITSLKNTARTIPMSSKELTELESELNEFLDYMPMSDDDRDFINDEFDKLKDRAKRNEGGRAILKNARL